MNAPLPAMDAGTRMAGWLLGLLLLAGSALAQTTGPSAPPPFPPAPASPVAFFRQLLAMTPDQRTQALTNKSDQARRIILARVAEYTALSPSERELRLTALHLRSLLLPLMKLPPDARAQSLATLPAQDRTLVEARLGRWANVPETLQAQFLEHEAALDFFTRIQNSPLPPMPPGLSPELDDQRKRLDSRLKLWAALPEPDRNRMLAQFRDFFETGPADLAKSVDDLNPNERRLVESIHRRFATLPEPQRRASMQGFERLASMSAEERTRFFRNVARWEALTPAERNVWRQLTRQVPDLPPLPPGMLPPLPPATNSVAGVNR